MTDHESHENQDLKRELGITRRGLMKRGAIVGGTLVWAAPVIQSLSPPAFAHVVSPVNHFCCHCFNADAKPSTVTLTSGYCLSEDRKSTRLNSSHANISYAVFCLKKKKMRNPRTIPSYSLTSTLKQN